MKTQTENTREAGKETQQKVISIVYRKREELNSLQNELYQLSELRRNEVSSLFREAHEKRIKDIGVNSFSQLEIEGGRE